MANYWIMDTETTGLKNPSGVVEYAAIRIDPVTLEVLEEHSSLCNPGMPIEPGAAAIHGLTDMDVMDAPKLEDVFAPKGAVVAIAHNWAYDRRYLSQHIDNLVGEVCTLVLARQYIKDSLNHKLGTLAQHLGITTGTAHRAAGDVVTTLGLLRVLVDKSGRSLESLTKAAATAKIMHTMPFGKFKGQAFTALPAWYVDWFLKQEDIDKDLKLSLEMALRVK